MVNIKAVIFDLDGTLTDSMPAIAYSVNKTLTYYKRKEKTIEELYRCINYGTRELIRLAFENTLDNGALDGAVAYYLDIYKENYCITKTAYSGINEALDVLKAVGLKLGVLTNKPHDITVKLVESIFGAGYFDIILGQGPFPPKPEVAASRHIIKKLGVKASEVLFVGDSHIDVQTARAAGFKFAGVTWGYKTKRELAEAGAEYFFENREDIIKILEKI